jgi:SAM-dependent methyltransferase
MRAAITGSKREAAKPVQILLHIHIVNRISDGLKGGQRFAFGENWSRFLAVLDDERIEQAKSSLRSMLNVETLGGKTFLDIGSGSGLFSLSARLLGAKVHSFDYDPKSVACTMELKRRYFAGDPNWVIEQGSVLDKDYLARLRSFDIVYSWGVLHHTGALWQALGNVAPLVRPEGSLFIAIYNHQHLMTPVWTFVKKTYNRLPPELRWLLLIPSLIRLWGPRTVYDLLRGKPFYTWRHYAEHSSRGMSAWHDVVDWVGGWPFETSKPDDILDFYRKRGFSLTRLRTCGGGLGCNEYVFVHERADSTGDEN